MGAMFFTTALKRLPMVSRGSPPADDAARVGDGRESQQAQREHRKGETETWRS